MKVWTVLGSPTAAQINEIAALLRSTGIVLLPTDTIYGLHAVATDEAAERIAILKGREEGKRFVTVASSMAQLESLGIEIPAVLRTIWPAPLTAVIRRDRSTVAVRIPDLEWLRTLLEQTGPLISTSANRAGEQPITSPQELVTELRNAIDGIVDAGRQEGKASAIVDFTGTEPQFIRDGDPRFTQTLRKTLMKKL